MDAIKYPDIPLYHYTSLGALMGIVENSTIRLTDYRFLNDTSELFFAINELQQQLVKFVDHRFYSFVLEAMENIKNEKMLCFPIVGEQDGKAIVTPSLQDAHYYVLSLSQKADELPMWRMYAKNGCCIKFNSQKIHEFFHAFRDKYMAKGIFNIIQGEVLYGPQQLFDADFLDMFFQHPNMFMLYGDILRYCLRRKTAAFEYEAEYRLGFHFGDHLFGKSDSEKNIDVEKIFVQSDNVIKPQIELKDFPVKELIEEIIVSPYNTSDLTVLGIQELLAKHSISKNIVKKSTVTIR